MLLESSGPTGRTQPDNRRPLHRSEVSSGGHFDISSITSIEIVIDDNVDNEAFIVLKFTLPKFNVN